MNYAKRIIHIHGVKQQDKFRIKFNKDIIVNNYLRVKKMFLSEKETRQFIKCFLKHNKKENKIKQHIY